MNHCECLSQHFLSDKINIKLHVLGAGMKDWIMCQVNCTEIVTEQPRSSKGDGKFRKKGLNSECFCSCNGHASIFGLSTGTGNQLLFLRAPRYKIWTKENAGPGGRPPIIRVTCPISITVGQQSEGSRDHSWAQK